MATLFADMCDFRDTARGLPPTNPCNGGTTGGTVTLSLAFYFAHLNNSSSGDSFRVQIVGATTQTVIEELGAAANATGSLVEAGVDDVDHPAIAGNRPAGRGRASGFRTARAGPRFAPLLDPDW